MRVAEDYTTQLLEACIAVLQRLKGESPEFRADSQRIEETIAER